jgi:hypothetical protein
MIVFIRLIADIGGREKFSIIDLCRSIVIHGNTFQCGIFIAEPALASHFSLILKLAEA